MIGLLTGSVVGEELTGQLVLDVSGVGYELSVPVGTVGKAERVGGLIRLHVHTHVREEALQLFGFASPLELRVFRMLLGVPNVGPKTALLLLSSLPPPELARAVQASDVAALSRVPGVGKKTAERLVLELQEKLVGLGARAAKDPLVQPEGQEDAPRLARALVQMGYRPAEAERAVKALGDQVGKAPLAELLKEALKALTS
jgi:Holliday junction DNA helicase RuvA